MLEPRWVRILVKVLLIWLVISGYFYFQKPVIYRYTDINAAIPIGENQLIIEEITVHNFYKDKSFIGNEELPWQYVRKNDNGNYEIIHYYLTAE